MFALCVRERLGEVLRLLVGRDGVWRCGGDFYLIGKHEFAINLGLDLMFPSFAFTIADFRVQSLVRESLEQTKAKGKNETLVLKCHGSFVRDGT